MGPNLVPLVGVVYLLGALGCQTPETFTSGARSPTPSASTSTVQPMRFETLGNAIQVSLALNEDRLVVGRGAEIQATFTPVTVRVARKSDGSTQAASYVPWSLASQVETQYCTSFDSPCEFNRAWEDYSRQVTLRLAVDWVGAREYWVGVRFRDVSGIVQSFSSGTQDMPKDFTLRSIRLTATIDERTPIAAFPPRIQTMVVTARPASAVSGSVKLESGRCCAGGRAGSTIQVTAEFSAASSEGTVTEMRLREFRARKCASDIEIAQAEWEPFEKERTFRIVGIPLNWSSFDVSVQYRDANGNLSPIYCADLAIEGMP